MKNGRCVDLQVEAAVLDRAEAEHIFISVLLLRS